MGVIYRGNTEFEDVRIPVVGKNEFGVDTLERVMQGGAPKLDAFLDKLKQGDTYKDKWYLQTWTHDGACIFPTVTLQYKGLASGTLPAPTYKNDTGCKTVTNSCSITSEAVAEIIKGSPMEGEEVANVTAQKTVVFYSPQTVYRYVTDKLPSGPSYDKIAFNAQIIVKQSRIVARWADKEATFAGNAPAELVSALASGIQMVVVHSSEPIIGSPYFECTDTVSLELLGDS